MRRDAIFYQLFQQFPSLFFTLLDHPPEQATNYRFESVEIKEPNFRIDGVFLPSESISPRIIFFVEVQFQPDEFLYHRFFSELFLYLYRNPTNYDNWYGVVIFPSRTLEPENTQIHDALLNSPQVKRIYLDELGEISSQPIGISLMQLMLASKTQMVEQAKQLITRVQQEDLGDLSPTAIIEVITTIVVYKFSNLSREEVEAMLGYTLQETRVYQEAKAEGQAEMQAKLLKNTVPLLLKSGLTIAQIAQQLEVDEASVQQAAQNATS